MIISTHYPNRLLLNCGQSVPRIKGCIRIKLDATFILSFLLLYLILQQHCGIFLYVPMYTLVLHPLCLQQCPGRTRVWWIKVWVQPESTISWRVSPKHLTGMVYILPGLGEGVGGLVTRTTCPTSVSRHYWCQSMGAFTSNTPASAIARLPVSWGSTLHCWGGNRACVRDHLSWQLLCGPRSCSGSGEPG